MIYTKLLSVVFFLSTLSNTYAVFKGDDTQLPQGVGTKLYSCAESNLIDLTLQTDGKAIPGSNVDIIGSVQGAPTAKDQLVQIKSVTYVVKFQGVTLFEGSQDVQEVMEQVPKDLPVSNDQQDVIEDAAQDVLNDPTVQSNLQWVGQQLMGLFDGKQHQFKQTIYLPTAIPVGQYYIGVSGKTTDGKELVCYELVTNVDKKGALRA